MKEHPILFSGPMVRAILDGKKTQTRRVVTPQPTRVLRRVLDVGVPGVRVPITQPDGWEWRDLYGADDGGHFDKALADHSPYGQPGDRLWVRETSAAWSHTLCRIVPFAKAQRNHDGMVLYRAGYEDPEIKVTQPMKSKGERWVPGIHMPRWAARLTLEVTEVRVQRLQDITEGDALAEGVTSGLIPADEYGPERIGYVLGQDDGRCKLYPTCCWAFEVGWDSINGDRATWASNPWVWALTFRRVQP